MKFQNIMYGIRPSIVGDKGKEEGALAAYTQQIHLRVKGTICTSFPITSQVQEVLKTPRCPQMVCCLVHSRKTAIAYGLLESDVEWDNCLSEASISFMPKQLQSLFVTMKPEGWPWIWPSQWHKDDCFDTWSKSS